MAAINQIKLNSTSTTYDVNDKRITTSAVSTATHFLATDSSVSSIAPITAANAASVLGVGTTPNSALTPQYNFLCGGSRGDGRICKYALYDGRGTGIIYINNNSGHHTAIIAFSFVSSYSAKFLYKSGDNWGHLYADNAKNIYVQHHTTWGAHLISNSTGLVADGYVTSTTGLTEITVTDNT